MNLTEVIQYIVWDPYMNPDSVIHINALNHFVASLFHDTVMNTCIYQFNWATVCPDI